jgi:hypothetical protein
MKYERQTKIAQELDARIPRSARRSEQDLWQNLLRSEVNARRLHGEDIEEAISNATARIRASHFPRFVPDIRPPRP